LHRIPSLEVEHINIAANGGTLSQPETRTFYGLIEKTDPNLVIVVHSWQISSHTGGSIGRLGALDGVVCRS